MNGMNKTIIVAMVVALLAPSISAIIVVSQMHQKQTDFDARLDKHEKVTAHGKVNERLTEHDTRLSAQDRSLDTVRKSNDRLANDLYQMRTDLRVLEQQVDILHSYGDNP